MVVKGAPKNGAKASISVLISHESKRLLIYLATILFVFACILWFALSIDYQSVTSQKIAQGLSPQIKYWVQTGDEFQIRRTLSSLVSGSLFDGAVILDSKGEVAIAYPASLAAEFHHRTPFFMKWNGITPVMWRCEYGSGNQELQWGALCLGTRPAPTSALMALLSILGGFTMMAALSMRKFRKLSHQIAEPLIRLRKTIEEIGTQGRMESSSIAHFQATEVNEVYLAFKKLIEDLKRHEAERQVTATEFALGKLAQQVAHDIRSPLAALEMILGLLDGESEEKRIIIRSAVTRIKDIANHLLETTRTKARIDAGSSAVPAEVSVHLLSSLIESLITEKRLQFRSKLGISIDFKMSREAYGLFASVNPFEFKRVLSNLVNNSVEALSDLGQVRITLAARSNEIEIIVRDNGKGIPADILPRLTIRGETFGKSDGSGLGLYHAKTTIESWGGSFHIESELGKGSSVTLVLPRAKEPAWFVPTLRVGSNSVIVALDDDTSIHQIWQDRFRSLPLVHLSTPEELRTWIRKPSSAKAEALFLVDHELIGHSSTGLNLIEELQIQKESILVTSRFEDTGVLDQCMRLGVRLIPKGMAGFVHIEFERNSKHLNANLAENSVSSPLSV